MISYTFGKSYHVSKSTKLEKKIWQELECKSYLVELFEGNLIQ